MAPACVGLVDGELDGVRVLRRRRQLAGHRRLAAGAGGVLGDAERPGTGQVGLGAVGHLHLGADAVGDQQHGAALAVGVLLRGAPDDLEGRAAVRVDRGGRRVGLRHADVLDRRVVAPRRVDRALQLQVAVLLEDERDRTSAVDGDVVHAVGARVRATELALAQDGHLDGLDALAGAVGDAPAKDGDALGGDRAGSDALLGCAGAGEEEAGRLVDGHGGVAVEGRRVEDGDRVGGRGRGGRRGAEGVAEAVGVGVGVAVGVPAGPVPGPGPGGPAPASVTIVSAAEPQSLLRLPSPLTLAQTSRR